MLKISNSILKVYEADDFSDSPNHLLFLLLLGKVFKKKKNFPLQKLEPSLQLKDLRKS